MKKLKPFSIIIILAVISFSLLINVSKITSSTHFISFPSVSIMEEVITDEEEKRETKLPDITILKKIMDFVKRSLPVS